MKKRVYVAYTGGTIGMKRSPTGYAPEPGYLASLLDSMPELRRDEIPEITLNEYSPLLDSANMTPETWQIMAHDIAQRYEDFDAFLILHGTDTLAYTASALPFMLQGLTKPVIVTGSQIPLCEVRSDARENFVTSLLIVSRFDIPEVMVFFGGQLLRGCRTVKVHSHDFEAFESPSFPALGRVGIDIDIRSDLLLTVGETAPLRAVQLEGPVVGILKLFPGISPALVDHFLQPPLRGVVLETFGVGNGPAVNREFVEVLGRAAERGVVIVNCSQCLKGRVNMSGYATGKALEQAGVVSGFDMTTEAALAKLYYLFSQGDSVDAIRRRVQFPMRGELTLPDLMRVPHSTD